MFNLKGIQVQYFAGLRRKGSSVISDCFPLIKCWLLENGNLRDNISSNYIIKCCSDESIERDEQYRSSNVYFWITETLAPVNKIENLGNEIVRVGKISLYPPRDLVAGIIIKLTQERLIGDKWTKFNACTQRSHRNRTEDTAGAGSIYTCGQRINLWAINRTKELGLQVKIIN